MKKAALGFLLLSAIFASAQSQKPAIFEKIEAEMKTFKVDTSAVPEDALTIEIRKMRNLKGGFNIEDAIDYKRAESLSKNEISQAESDKMKAFFENGKGKKWLDNAVVWIYRKQFSLEEIQDLIRFYQTSAGQKMAHTFPLILIESTKAAEFIGAQLKNQNAK